MALDNRNFLRRAVTYLVENGVRQFIDIGSGIPTVGNAHHIARALSPGVAVVYADNDPVAVAQSKLLLRDDPATVAIDADLRYPADILDNTTVRGHLDFDQPIGLLIIAVLHFIPDHDDPATILAAYRDALPPASYIALPHLTDETAPPDLHGQVRRCIDTYQSSASPLVTRTRSTLADRLTGLHLVTPGITVANHWLPDSEPADGPDHDLVLGAVARLP